MRGGLDDSTQPWIGRAIDTVLPPELMEIQGRYYSWKPGAEEAMALVIGSPLLFAFAFKFGPPKDLATATVVATFNDISLAEVLNVAVETEVSFDSRENPRRSEDGDRITVTLGRDLAPVGHSFQLPLDEGDYSGPSERQVRACRSFADALLLALLGPWNSRPPNGARGLERRRFAGCRPLGDALWPAEQVADPFTRVELG